MRDELAEWFYDFAEKSGLADIEKCTLVAIPTSRGHILASCPHRKMCKSIVVELMRPDGSSVFAPPEAPGL